MNNNAGRGGIRGRVVQNGDAQSGARNPFALHQSTPHLRNHDQNKSFQREGYDQNYSSQKQSYQMEGYSKNQPLQNHDNRSQNRGGHRISQNSTGPIPSNPSQVSSRNPFMSTAHSGFHTNSPAGNVQQQFQQQSQQQPQLQQRSHHKFHTTVRNESQFSHQNGTQNTVPSPENNRNRTGRGFKHSEGAQIYRNPFQQQNITEQQQQQLHNNHQQQSHDQYPNQGPGTASAFTTTGNRSQFGWKQQQQIHPQQDITNFGIEPHRHQQANFQSQQFSADSSRGTQAYVVIEGAITADFSLALPNPIPQTHTSDMAKRAVAQTNTGASASTNDDNTSCDSVFFHLSEVPPDFDPYGDDTPFRAGFISSTPPPFSRFISPNTNGHGIVAR